MASCMGGIPSEWCMHRRLAQMWGGGGGTPYGGGGVLPMMTSVLYARRFRPQFSSLARSHRVHFRAWLDPLGSIFEPGSIP